MLEGIIDISHHNGPDIDFQVASQNGIVAVIHKATQGTSYVDRQFGANRMKAQKARLLFGSYHFGTGDDGAAQAEFYLNTVGPSSGELLALDFESNNAGPSMTLEEAREFVSVVHRHIGKWPALYAGHFLKELLAGRPDAILTNCPLWLAQYSPTPVLPVGWTELKLWQWTDGSAGGNPAPVPGVGHCDQDRFNGTAVQLPSFWASVSP